MSPLARRRFDHFAVEPSLAVGVRVPRFPLWLSAEPHAREAAGLVRFCDEVLDAFLEEQQLPAPTARERERLRRSVARFDPSRRAPEEVFSNWSES